MGDEPHAGQIPSILLRTVLRCIARILLLLAGITCLLGLTIGLCALGLCTWRNARPKRVQAAAELLASAIAFAKTFRN